jgi:hypothetical protein
MAGVGQSDLPVVSAGVQATPLVTPADPNTLGSNAVANLVDAFHKGFITQDDIVNRIGDLGQAKNKALLESLGEYVSPEAIHARKNELSLSDPTIEAKKMELQRNKWNTVFGGGVDAFQQYGYLFGHNDVPMDANGNPDFQKMGQIGQTLKDPLYRSQLAEEALKPDPARDVPTKGPNGEEGKRIFNRWGREITPGSPDDIQLRNMVGLIPAKAIEAGSAPTPKLGDTHADVVSAAGAPAGSGSSLGTFDPNLGMVTKGGMDIGEARDKILEKNQSFKIWESNKGNIDAFHNIVHTIEQTEGSKDPADVQRRLEAERGLIYTLSELQQNQTQGTIPRSVITDWEHIVASPGLSDKVKSVVGKLTGNNPLTDNQVKSLIALGKNQIAGKSSAAISALKLAEKHAPGSLSEDEEALLKSGGLSEINGTRAAQVRELQNQYTGGEGKAGAAPVKTISAASPVPKDKVIVTKQGRLKSNGDGTFTPIQ